MEHHSPFEDFARAMSIPSRAWERVYASGWGRSSTASSSDEEDEILPSAACAGDHSAESRVFSMPIAEQFACIASLLGRGDVAALEGFAGVALKRYERALTYTAYIFPGATNSEASGELKDSLVEAKAAAEALASGAFGVHGVDAHVALALARLHAHMGITRASAALRKWRDTITSAHRAANVAREMLPPLTTTATTAAADAAPASLGRGVVCGACGRSLADVITRTCSDVAVMIVAAERECGIEAAMASAVVGGMGDGVLGSGAGAEGGEILKTKNEATTLEPCLDCCPWVSKAGAAERELATQVRQAEEAVISRAAFARALRDGV